MQVIFEGHTLLDLDDKPIPGTADGGHLTLKLAVCEALTTGVEGDHALEGDKKLHQYKLARRIKKSAGPVDVSAEDITLIKARLAKRYNSLVVGQCYEIIERNGQPEEGEPAPPAGEET